MAAALNVRRFGKRQWWRKRRQRALEMADLVVAVELVVAKRMRRRRDRLW